MLLSDKVIAIYCLVDDLLQACNHHTPEGCRCSDAEIITTALVSALLFKGNQSLTIDYMRTHLLAPALPLKSGFTKRLHRLADLLYSLFQQMGAIIKELNCSGMYILDSFPLAVCHNMRISRCKLLTGEVYRGAVNMTVSPLISYCGTLKKETASMMIVAIPSIPLRTSLLMQV